LISLAGLRQVRDTARHLTDIERVGLHPEIHRLILEASLLKIFGADRWKLSQPENVSSGTFWQKFHFSNDEVWRKMKKRMFHYRQLWPHKSLTWESWNKKQFPNHNNSSQMRVCFFGLYKVFCNQEFSKMTWMTKTVRISIVWVEGRMVLVSKSVIYWGSQSHKKQSNNHQQIVFKTSSWWLQSLFFAMMGTEVFLWWFCSESKMIGEWVKTINIHFLWIKFHGLDNIWQIYSIVCQKIKWKFKVKVK
jgi:hypothetical protein